MKGSFGIGAFFTSSIARQRCSIRSSSFRIGAVGSAKSWPSSQPSNRPTIDFALNMSTASDNTDAPIDDSISNHQNRGNIMLKNHLKRLQSSPAETLLLDGGTGEEIFLRGVPDDRKIWSATAIVNAQYHYIVEDAHRSFIDAGSQAITTNSYGITPGVGFTDGEEVKRLVGTAGKIARKAVTTASASTTPTALVLGSLGPQVESYRPDLIMNHDDGVRVYQYIIQGLYPFIDVYLAETMSCLEEACQAIDSLSLFYSGLIEAGETLKHPLLVSFTLQGDGKIRSGEPVVEVLPKLIQYAHDREVELIGVLFNCCEPESITKVLKEIRANPHIHQYLQHPPEPSSPIQACKDKPTKIYLGAYANRLTPVDPQWSMESSDEAQAMRGDLTPEKYWDEFIKLWHSSNKGESDGDTCGPANSDNKHLVGEIGGMQLFGGCCGIGPGHISVLKERLTKKEK